MKRIANISYQADNLNQITEIIDALLDTDATVRYDETPRPRAMPAMPTHPSKEIKANPFTASYIVRAYA